MSENAIFPGDKIALLRNMRQAITLLTMEIWLEQRLSERKTLTWNHEL